MHVHPILITLYILIGAAGGLLFAAGLALLVDALNRRARARRAADHDREVIP